MAPVERIFLGWDSPPIVLAARWLASRAVGSDLDLSSLTVVVSGGRAGRVLTSLLLEIATEQGLVLSPPMCVTPGEAAEAALGPDDAKGLSPAGPILSKLAWIEALRRSTGEELSGLVADGGPRAGMGYWSAVANLLIKCHDDLAGEGMMFADVPARAKGLALFEEEDRWKAASAIQHRYERTLESWGLYDSASRRLRRLREPSPDSSAEIVLLGVAELNRSTRDALEHSGAKIRALVFAPPEEAGAFDGFGCVVPGAWVDRKLPADAQRIEFADGPEAQAEAALGFVAELDGRYAAHEVVIGVPDASVVPALERVAGECDGVSVRAAAGVPFFRTAPGVALRLICDHAESGGWSTLAALVRHADVERWLCERLGREGVPASSAWMVAIDEVRRKSLAVRIPETIADEMVAAAVAAVGELCRPLCEGGARSIREWPAVVMEILRTLYGGLQIEQKQPELRRVVEACRLVKTRLSPLAECEALDAITLEGPEFLATFLEIVEQDPLPPRADDDAIELLGWLELAMDPAAAVVLTGMNEGSVPAAFGADPFLPNNLRQRLGMACDRSRLARDLYVATALCHSRERVAFIAGRRDADGGPLTPSRILFAASDEQIVQRLAEYSGLSVARGARIVPVRRLRAGGENLFRTRPLVEIDPLEGMAVTAFRAYMASPYRFFLEHAMGLAEQEEPGADLDDGQFGTLVHEALRDFGNGEARDSSDEGEIREAIVAALQQRAEEWFGPEPSVPVWLQIRSAQLRLERFAAEQALWRRQGWHIHRTEWTPDKDTPASIMVGDESFVLRGSIDRIDVHDDGRVAILDYKTGDTALTPEKAHQTKTGWIDLQLPLYRHLAQGLKLFTLDDRVTLGYVALARDPASIKILPASWDMETLRSADAAAVEVVRSIRSREFGELGRVYRTNAALDAICGFGILGAPPGESDEEDES